MQEGKSVLVSEYDIRDILPIAITVIVAAIGVAYGLNVVSDVQDDLATCTNAADVYNKANKTCYEVVDGNNTGVPVNAEYNATGDALTGLSKLTTKLPLIMTVVVAALVIGILLRYLFVRYT